MQIKNFNQYFETIMQPHESVLRLVDIIKHTSFRSVAHFNEVAKEFNVTLIKYNDFIKYLTARGDDKSTFPHAMSRFAYTDGINGKIFLIYTPSYWDCNTNDLLKDFIKMLRHEGVHRSQMDKYIEHDDVTDVKNIKDYLKHPRELMAMARTIADELLENPRDLAKFKETKRLPNYGPAAHTIGLYKSNFKKDEKEYKRLLKYVMKYLESER